MQLQKKLSQFNIVLFFLQHFSQSAPLNRLPFIHHLGVRNVKEGSRMWEAQSTYFILGFGNLLAWSLNGILPLG